MSFDALGVLSVLRQSQAGTDKPGHVSKLGSWTWPYQLAIQLIAPITIRFQNFLN